MEGFINWGSESPEQRRIRQRWEEDLLFEQARMKAMAKQAAGAVGSGSAGTPLSVPVESSTVVGATVMIGWTDDLRYTAEDGQIYRISQTGSFLDGEIPVEAVIQIAVTGQNGRAEFGLFNPQWKVEDYTDYYAGDAAGPKTLYAPIRSYGGVALEGGYNASPMQSNAGFARVNPITTILTTVNRYQLPEDTEDVDLLVSTVEEWTGKKFTEQEKLQVKTGNVDASLYSTIVEPVKRVKDLFQGLTVSDKKYNIELNIKEESNLVETSLSAIAAVELSGVYNFGTYYNDRKAGGEKRSAREWAAAKIDVSKFETALGYTVSDDAPKQAMIDLMYKKGTTASDFAYLTTEYSTSLQKKTDDKDDPKVPGFLVNIYQADRKLGLRFYTTEDVNTIDGKFDATLHYKGDFKKSFYPAVITQNGDKDYTLNVVATVGEFYGGIYTIEAVLATSKTQNSNAITYSSKDGSFTDTVTGASIDPLKGSDPEPPKDGKSITAYVYGLDKQIELAESGEINGFPMYYYNDAMIGNLYVYWNGAGWVGDNDKDPKEVYANGPKDGSLTGDYSDEDGKIQMTIKIA
jgi:hypothetical protein